VAQYAPIALGRILIFALMNVLNFAHGQMYVLGGFITYATYVRMGVPFVAALFVASVTLAAIGAVVEKFLFRPVIKRSEREESTILLAAAVAFFLCTVILLLFGEKERGVPKIVSGVFVSDSLIMPYGRRTKSSGSVSPWRRKGDMRSHTCRSRTTSGWGRSRVATGRGSNLASTGVLARFPRLPERYSQAAGTMSGGEQQMLVIGRALMAVPRLLLFDEPSLGIAPKLVHEIAPSIVAINRQESVSVLLVEQNSRMALRISQRAYVLATGSVALTGDSAALATDERVKRLYLGGEL
jgi:hypothetical protein